MIYKLYNMIYNNIGNIHIYFQINVYSRDNARSISKLGE